MQLLKWPVLSTTVFVWVAWYSGDRQNEEIWISKPRVLESRPKCMDNQIDTNRIAQPPEKGDPEQHSRTIPQQYEKKWPLQNGEAVSLLTWCKAAIPRHAQATHSCSVLSQMSLAYNYQQSSEVIVPGAVYCSFSDLQKPWYMIYRRSYYLLYSLHSPQVYQWFSPSHTKISTMPYAITLFVQEVSSASLPNQLWCVDLYSSLKLPSCIYTHKFSDGLNR